MQKFVRIKKYILASTAVIMMMALGACRKGFLDTVPDNITTLNDVFTKQNLSLQWLARVYNAVEDMWDQPYTTQWSGMSDELDYTWIALPLNNGALVPDGTSGYWQSYYQAIRYAGVFLQNIDKNKEIMALANGPQLIKQYKGEARFLRAYYYWMLMKIYGPVVLLGEAPGDVYTDYQTPRSSWSECVAYVLSEMDKAKQDVPTQFYLLGSTTDLDKLQTGRITKNIVSAVQSQILLYDASPLYNGNSEMADFKNFDGKQLISQSADASKWKKAADAAKAVIDLNQWQLYRVADPDPFKAAYLSCKNLYWDGWKTEGIWVRPSSAYQYQWEQHCSPRNTNGNAWNGMGVTQELVDVFRMNNGKPIADPTSGYAESGFSPAKAGFYVANTFNMYVNREPRFYVDVTFSGSVIPTIPKAGESYVGFFFSGNCGKGGAPRDWPKTGYTARKNVNPNVNFNPATTVARPAMIIRLAEIYLNYAEALNEYAAGSTDILTYLNMVRDRGGLPPLLPGLSQDEMRKQIRLERQIELCFEGQRYFDVRRWKVADQPAYHQGGTFYGMNMDKGSSLTDMSFYQRTPALRRSDWQRKNYFWPVPQSEVDRNKKLVQFPGY